METARADAAITNDESDFMRFSPGWGTPGRRSDEHHCSDSEEAQRCMAAYYIVSLSISLSMPLPRSVLEDRINGWNEEVKTM
jgi:hypothetical protein